MKCWCCGNYATRTRLVDRIGTKSSASLVERKPSKFSRNYCDDCYSVVTKLEKEEKTEYIRLKKKMMFLTAVENLESQRVDMQEYKESIDVVEEFISNKPDKFDSSYEVLSAIVLVKHRIMSKMQYKVGKYQVDFLLPEMEVVLEIDGERHKHKKEYDSERDKYIKSVLGNNWEIVRINTDYLDMNADRLVDAINKVVDYRMFN